MKKVLLLMMVMIMSNITIGYSPQEQHSLELILDTGYTPQDQHNVQLVLGDTGEPPTSTTFTVSVADSQSYIIFNSSSKSAAHLAAQGQTDGQPILNVTNTGNVAQDFKLYLNISLPIGFVAYYNNNSNPDTSYVLDDSQQILFSNMAASEERSLWLWTNFTDQTEQEFERELNISSEQI